MRNLFGVFCASGLLLVLIVGTPVLSQVMLQGGVEHMEKLEPIDKNLKKGQKFTEPTLDSAGSKGAWYRIPAWLAGRSWYSEYETHDFFENLKTGKVDRRTELRRNAGTQTIGWERDAKGDIWQYYDAPFTRRSEGNGTYDIQQTDEMELVSSEPDKVVERSMSTQIKVDAKTNEILYSRRTEQLHTYTLVSEGKVRVDTSAKVFDENGSPSSLQKLWTYEIRTEPFRNVAFFRGQDRQKQFCNYLASKGLSDLIPHDMTPSD